MNVGQILETHLGLAAKGLGDKIDKMLREQKAIAEIREFLNKIYNGVDGRQVDLEQFSDQEIIEMSGNLCNGVPMATQVFDGASETGVKQLLALADMPESGQMQL
jgi:DNA-directed RNA polymerase subunit beta